MKLDDIGTMIASRDLDIIDGGKVRVTIGMPQEFPEGGNFYCPYQIEGLGDEIKVRYAGGVDAVQALQLANNCIATVLYTSDEFKEGRLRHLGMKNLGFPALDAIKDLIPKDGE